MQAFFSVVFSSTKEKIHREKTPRRNSVNVSKVRRITSLQERWKNYAKRRQSQTYTETGKVNMLVNTKNSIIINKGKDLKISKKQV